MFLFPALCVLSNSMYLLLSLLPVPIYLHYVVIPAEEALLGRLFGQAYVDYCAAVPRWGTFWFWFLGAVMKMDIVDLRQR